MSAVQSILESKGWTVRSIDREATVFEAVEQMCRDHVGSLLVLGGRGPGILTDRDVLTRVVLEERDPRATTVAEVMTDDVACIEVDVDISDAMQLMTRRRCRHLPVVDPAGKVIGMLSIGDIVHWINQGLDSELRDFTAYVCGAGVHLA